MWDSFIAGYCKVEFLCYAGEPNWLGWVPIGFVGFIIGLIGLSIVMVVLEWITEFGKK